MKRLITLFFVGLKLASSAQSNTVYYTLTIKFDPSFLYSSKLIIHSGQDSSWAQLEMYKNYKDVNPISVNKVKVEVTQLIRLTNFLNNYKFRDNSSIDSVVTYKKTATGDSIRLVEQNMGKDGIIVHGVLDQNKTTRKFEFWSPNKGTENEKFAQILFGVLYNAYKDEMSINYFELLEQYFPHGLGLKKISNDPLKYRLYGDISVSEDSSLEKFFDSLPHNKKVFIDMSNFSGMGTMFYDIIKDYFDANKKIYWVNPSDAGLYDLYETGIPNSHILS